MDFFEFAMKDDSVERVKREKKAASAECTPISLDIEKQTGIFKGSGGTYETWLDECSCVDYSRRRRPCKHMYRLAAELGLYDLGTLKSDTSKLKLTKQEKTALFDKAISLVDGYSETTQREIQRVLWCWHGGNPCVVDRSTIEQPLLDGFLILFDNPVAILEENTQKRTVEGMLNANFVFPDEVKQTKKARYNWCLEHPEVACAIVYPDDVVTSISSVFEPVALKIYTYLNKKFYPEDYEGGEDIVIEFKAY